MDLTPDLVLFDEAFALQFQLRSHVGLLSLNLILANELACDLSWMQRTPGLPRSLDSALVRVHDAGV